mmetsp:Transcript_30777/g.55759  ORF Transcript_30777/g.55759 Transcript_30777/m.55759 type:complete len:120 (-) Transcript_30777:360-719(-)|eukprot:CAMPEP_0201866594 /NCGR_PEP_ID=MMETSP0902-20130614/1120_1 /ASSEMBLY_ACC=CAM_ASM_000551 /TAXON_ID=420261 /ORGANISM="Thalassiosira antarctica, Strain CCMP982" /LENGTH=119 /DNA_ID=CAMNT_0048391589 /DNA_START=115 /DNA_END=474 /DNA_ORIENTATION=-
MSGQQVDGAFPRLNASMLHAGNWDQTIVSLVGKAVTFDGQETLEFECVDGGKVQVQVTPDFPFSPGMAMEIMGAANDDKTVQHFISRELGEDFDFANYNQLVSKVLTNPKYADLFGISS